MDGILLAFFTGLTTGGLSCLAIQGGLLAGSLAQQLEKDIQAIHPRETSRHLNHTRKDSSIIYPQRIHNGHNPQIALPILLFLSAKVVAYTVLGFMLGMIGSVFQFNIITRAILLLGIGLFMIGNALRMLNVHPIFRYFSLEPPSFLSHYIRRISRYNVSIVTPLFLGMLTVFIPCGVTQSIMAVAVGTGDPWQGASLLFAFTLGTSPIFFSLAYLATTLGARLEKWFMRVAAVTVLILGLVSMNSGLNLMGSPLAIGKLGRAVFPSIDKKGSLTVEGVSPVEGITPVGGITREISSLVLNARNDGYSPKILHSRSGEATTLYVVTDQTHSCSRAFVIPELGIDELLPVTGRVAIDIPAQEAGKRLWFTCSMGMYTGEIVFDL